MTEVTVKYILNRLFCSANLIQRIEQLIDNYI